MKDRRRHRRICPKGTVLLRASGEAHGRIANLSAGGVYVLTDEARARYTVGDTLDLEIRTDDPSAAWVVADGHIGRVRPDGIAIVFARPSEVLLHMIDRLATASHAHARVVSIVLIDADDDRRSAMSAGFRSAGCGVIEASTPLEAIVRLGESRFEPDVIAVADSHPSAGADAMRAFIERDHPRARLVAIGDEVFAPDGFASWLAASLYRVPDDARS
ncbi:MAG: PilZ domain-containing protein [Deltaproteobacteria bacterium]|nr:PilZ domain-containing protein [Deltaproteobacteria bacterium]